MAQLSGGFGQVELCSFCWDNPGPVNLPEPVFPPIVSTTGIPCLKRVEPFAQCCEAQSKVS